MKRLRFLHGIVLLSVVFLLFEKIGQAEEINIPAPVGDIYVQDFANILTAQERAELINMGKALEDQTSAQVVVLTVDTTEDVPMTEYANEAFRKYGIGSKQENNGIMLILALRDRQIRIEVGYGLEGRIPDGKAGRILDQYALPYLQNQQPNKAIIETYKVLANEVLNEYGQEGLQSQTPSEQDSQMPLANSGNGDVGIPSWLLIIIVVVVLFLDFKFFGGFLTQMLLSILMRGGRGGGGSSGGGFRGGGGGSSGGGGAGRGW